MAFRIKEKLPDTINGLNKCIGKFVSGAMVGGGGVGVVTLT